MKYMNNPRQDRLGEIRLDPVQPETVGADVAQLDHQFLALVDDEDVGQRIVGVEGENKAQAVASVHGYPTPRGAGRASRRGVYSEGRRR